MSRKWIKRALAGVLTLSAAGGCKQQLFMEPGDYKDSISNVKIPSSLETNPHGPVAPGLHDKMGEPVTVLDFVRPPRHMTLRECVALSLEQGNVGGQSPQQFGFKNDTIDSFTGRSVGGTDAIRAFAIDPAVAQTEIERSLSRFDTRWVTQMEWGKVDQPTPAQFLSFQNARDTARLSSTLVKPLPTGGVVGITASTDYSKFDQRAANQTQLVNPNYTPRLAIGIEQPLLRMFGVEVNQIAGTHPYNEGNQLPGVLAGLRSAGGIGTEGILITRIRLDQAKADFETKVNFMLVNVEAAYWNLYASYYNLYAQEEGLRQAFEGYRFIYIRVINGSDPPQRLDQIQAQFHRFQRQVYQARGQVLESERQLRGLLGLRSDDGARLVPIDEPNLAPYKPDFHEAANDAITLRPELMLARQDLMFRSLDLRLQKNLRRPDLRGYMSYDVAGLGTRIGGATEDIGANGAPTPGNAYGSFIDNRFNSWTLGFRLDMPLGFRDANGLVRAAQLNMTKSYVQLRDAELKTVEYLAGQYRRVIQSHAEIAPARAEREALQKFIARIRERIRIGSYTQDEFLNLITVQQQLAAAIAAESQAISNYNIALASFEFAKGTIQQYNNVSIGEGALPPWVQKRAADHIRERTEAAIKLREAPAQPVTPSAGGHPVAPAVGTNSLLKLPAFAEKRDPLPELPAPRPGDPKELKDPKVGGGGAVRPWPGTPGIGQPLDTDPRPLPTGLPGGVPAGGVPAGGADPTFTPNGTVTLPAKPIGTKPYTGTPEPLPTGTSGNIFVPGGTVTLPPPPKPLSGGTNTVPPFTAIPPTGTPGGSGGDFVPDGRVTLPKRTGEPIWGPGGAPAPAPVPLPPATGFAPPPSVAPLPPIIPPTLP